MQPDDREQLLKQDVMLVATAGLSLVNGMHFSPWFDPVAILLKPFVAGTFLASPLAFLYLILGLHLAHDAPAGRRAGRALRALQGRAGEHADVALHLVRGYAAALDARADGGGGRLNRSSTRIGSDRRAPLHGLTVSGASLLFPAAFTRG